MGKEGVIEIVADEVAVGAFAAGAAAEAFALQDVFDFHEVVVIDERADGLGDGVDVRSCHVNGGAGVGRVGEGAGAGEELAQMLEVVLWFCGSQGDVLRTMLA